MNTAPDWQLLKRNILADIQCCKDEQLLVTDEGGCMVTETFDVLSKSASDNDYLLNHYALQNH